MVSATTQATMQVSTSSTGVSAASQLAMLVAFAPPSTRAVRTSQSVMQVSTSGNAVPAVTQLAMLVAYRTGPVENLNTRAWGFSLDGHTFYVLTLGEQGTFVYDEKTGQWSQWKTAGLNTWNMEIGTTWRGDIIAADQSNPTIWRLDPTSFIDDDYKSQTRAVTGGLAMRQRTFIPNFSFRLTASLGEPDVPGTLPVTIPTVTLSYSDNQGKTFVNAGSITLNVDEFTQELAWLSLGTMQPPQRVFRVEDTGAVARIDGADAEVGDEGD